MTEPGGRPGRPFSLEAAAGGGGTATLEAVPHVVAWNITRRCNLECGHCYISAGAWQPANLELPTATCLRVVDEILAVNPHPLLILSGGEPLLREDLEQVAARAQAGGATVVVGTNGTRLTRERIASLAASGVSGFAVSVDSLDARYHDRFRHGEGALSDTLAAVERLREARLDFIVQTTLTKANRAEIPQLVGWAAEQGAVSFNLYFVVSTGRAEDMRGLPPGENEEVLRELLALERQHRGRMLVRSKCQPQVMRLAHESGSDSPLLAYATRCPCGVQYCRITPEGFVTPCPYMPKVAGSLSTTSFGDIWRRSELFLRLRGGALGGRCGECEYRAVCGGCRARAFAESGDELGQDASCDYQPRPGAALVTPSGPTLGMPLTASGLPWSDEARSRMERVPSFVRGFVSARVEDWARRRGLSTVTAEALDQVRREMPVDFGKRLPFFARRDGEDGGPI